MINTAIVEGYTTKDGIIKHTKTNSSKPYVVFFIGNNRPGTENSDFIKVFAYGNRALNFVKYVGKGSLISVQGRTQSHFYNKDGRDYREQYIVAERISFLVTKKPGMQQEEQHIDNIGINIVNDDIINEVINYNEVDEILGGITNE